MKKTIEFEYTHKDMVKIKANGMQAEVLALHSDEHEHRQFHCRYTDATGTVYDKWFYANDIEDWTE